MAIITTIRKKSGFAVGIIALAMVSFMILGDLLGPNSRLLGGNNNVVGEIAGEKVTYEEFDLALQNAKNNYASQTGKAPTEEELVSLREQTWGQMILKIAYRKEFDRLGIAVSDDELFDMVQGNNVHPVVKQTFVNPQTKAFDRSLVKKYLGEDWGKMPQTQKDAWVNFENGLTPERELQKYNNLVKLSAYVTTMEAKRNQDEQNTKANVKYLLVPFFTISDSTIKVTDGQLQEYLDKNKERYKVEESRAIEYVTIPVKPSKTDSASIKTEVDELVQQFAAAENDSMFVKANSDVPFNGTYVNVGSLPEKLKNQTLEKGKIVGPFNENGAYTIYKVLNTRDSGPASARASHILIKPENQTPEGKVAAKKKAEDILAKIKGGADFTLMAAQNGQDGTASTGGDLGYFSEGAMVAPFEKAVFAASGPGLLPNLVETDFGYHIVKVTAPKTNKSYQIGTISRAIGSSDETREMAFSKANQFLGNSTSLNAFRENIKKDKTLAKSEAKTVRAADRNVNNLANARELIRWAFGEKTEVGDVAPQVFEIDDQFVIAAVVGEREKGYSKVADIKEELTAAVRNELKAKKISEKLAAGNGTLEQVAAKYGSEAVVRTASGVTFASTTVEGLGYDPVATGKIFGLKPGQRSKPFEGQTGVVMVEVLNVDKIPATGDILAVKKQLEMSRSSRAEGNTYQLIKDKADIKDNRVKFF